MMFYKDTKAMVHSSDGDTDLFISVAGVLKGNTLVPCLFIIFLNYILQMSIDLITEYCFTLKKARSR